MHPQQPPRAKHSSPTKQTWHRYELALLAYNQALAGEKVAASRSGVSAQYRRTRSAYLRQHIFRPRPTCNLPPTPPPSPAEAESPPKLEYEPDLEMPLSPTKPFVRHVRFSSDLPDNSSRDQRFYHRKSWRYAPGRWADASGEGFWNTSDPFEEDKKEIIFLAFGEKEEDSDEEMDDAPDMVEDDEDEEKDDDSDLEEMTPAQLAERTKMIEARLMALRKADAERGREGWRMGMR